MDPEKIERLLEIVARSGMGEVEIEEGDFRLVVRAAAPAAPAPAAQMMYAAPPPAAPAPPAAAPAAAQAAPAAEAAPASTGVVVQAPIVGTFYRSGSPDADPFVKEGQTVAIGDVLCIIEAMKLMNEITCETAGTVRQVLVQNAQPVEYDQPLFVIEPS